MTNAMSGISSRERNWGLEPGDDHEADVPKTKVDPCDVFQKGVEHDFDGCPTFSVKDAKLFATGPNEAHDVEPSDVLQRQTGDCYLASSLAALATTDAGRAHIHSMIQTNLGKDGQPESYTVTFKARDQDFWNKSGLRETYHDRKIEVDASFPKGTNETKGGEIWPAIVEKAYAELNGGYKNTVHGGWPEDAFATLGVKSEHHDFSGTYGGSDLVKAMQDRKAVTMYTRPACVGEGLVNNHAYSLESAFKVGDETYVQLRNPWGNEHPKLAKLSDIEPYIRGIDVATP